jgi:hypothetical protein
MAVRVATGAAARLAALSILLVGALGACGVGPSHTLDTSSVERQIAEELASRYPIGTPTVVCTRRVRAVPGATFSCSATIDGQTLVLTGTVTDRSGRYTVTPTASIIEAGHAASLIEREIAASAGGATVDCGNRAVLVVPVGHTFLCTAHVTGQQPRPVTVTVDNLQGDVRISLPPPPPAGTSASRTPP